MDAETEGALPKLDADALREKLVAMHRDDIADLERLPVGKREHGTRLLKATRRQILIDQLTGAKPAPPNPIEDGRAEGLLERLAREEAAEIESAADENCPDAAKPTDSANPVRTPAPA